MIPKIVLSVIGGSPPASDASHVVEEFGPIRTSEPSTSVRTARPPAPVETRWPWLITVPTAGAAPSLEVTCAHGTRTVIVPVQLRRMLHWPGSDHPNSAAHEDGSCAGASAELTFFVNVPSLRSAAERLTCALSTPGR